MIVAAVLEIHMESTATASIIPSTTRRGPTPTTRTVHNASRV